MIVGDDVDDHDDQNNNNRTIDNDNVVEHPCGKLDLGDGYDTWGTARMRILTSACKAQSSQKSPLGAVGIHVAIPSL